MADALIPLYSTTLASATASVTISGIPGTYRDLRLVFQGTTSGGGNLVMRFNGDSASNYSYHGLFGDGSSVASNAGASQTYAWAGPVPGSLNSANIFGASVIDILDWQGTENKTVRSLAGTYGSTYKYAYLLSGAWYSTAAVTSLALYPISGTNFDVGSRFSLYGLK